MATAGVTMKMEHKFFVADIDNDLESLTLFVEDLESKLISGNLVSLPDGIFDELTSEFGSGTMALSYYNIFDYNNEGIDKLKETLVDLLKEACVYYGIDYSAHRWGLHGWFNRNDKTQMMDVSPIDNPNNFHEHLNGIGAPNFHGYYSVEAEPSVTVYKINKDPENIRVNVNKNNRVILSEVGHPHGMGNWKSDSPRITIAYDIVPVSDEELETDKSYWTILNESVS